MNDIPSGREALDLLRANSQLIRQIREIYIHVTKIEDQYGLAACSRYSDISRQFMSIGSMNGDVEKKRAFKVSLQRELSAHRNYLNELKVIVRTMNHK